MQWNCLIIVTDKSNSATVMPQRFDLSFKKNSIVSKTDKAIQTHVVIPSDQHFHAVEAGVPERITCSNC